MNERIEKAYAQRPKRWVFELSVAVIVTALIVWLSLIHISEPTRPY